MPEMSVVIPTLGRRPVLVRVLDRLSCQRLAREKFEVIVAADAATDDPPKLRSELQARDPLVEFVVAGEPGASAARNAGWRHASSPLILFIDDDILPRQAMLGQHLEWHRRHGEEEVGVLGHVGWAPQLKRTAFMRWLEHGIQFDYPNIRGDDAGWGRFYTANVSVKKSLLERVGGFDEHRLPYGHEDLDLGLRLSQIGLRLLYNARARADHLHEMDVEFWKRRVRRIAESERRFVRIHPEIDPHFYPLFKRATEMPAASGRGAPLIRFVPRSFPWLGKRAWQSADIHYRQVLAPEFLAAWDQANDPALGQNREEGPESLTNT